MTLPWYQSFEQECPTGHRWTVHFAVGHVVVAPVVRILGSPPNDDVQVVEILVNGIQQLDPDARIAAHLFQKPFRLARTLVLLGGDNLNVVLRARARHTLTVQYFGEE